MASSCARPITFFDLFTNYSYEEIVHSALSSPSFEVQATDDAAKSVPHLDAVVTRDPGTRAYGIVLVNLHGDSAITCKIRGLTGDVKTAVTARTLTADSVDAYNDIDQPDAVSISTRHLTIGDPGDFDVNCPPHSVTMLNLD